MVTEGLDADTDAAVAALYGGPAATFVAGRDALARELRTAGRRDEAAAVKALRKPGLAAWVLDAGAHADPAAVADLAGAVESLAAAQSGGGGDLRAAMAGLREAQGRVADAAVAAAGAHGHSADRAQVAASVLAVVADPQALADLVAGRLVAVPAAGGLGVALAAGAPVAPAAPAPAPRGTRAAADRPARTAAPKQTLRGARPKVTPGKAASSRVVARAEAALTAAARAAREAAATADAAEDAARTAEREVTAARRRADTAQRAATLARQKADAAATRRADAEARLAAARRGA
jgi:hypothetical protein